MYMLNNRDSRCIQCRGRDLVASEEPFIAFVQVTLLYVVGRSGVMMYGFLLMPRLKSVSEAVEYRVRAP